MKKIAILGENINVKIFVAFNYRYTKVSAILKLGIYV